MARPLNRLPPLNALRAFVAAAKHLSFSKAATELHVTPAAVSQQVKQLEDQLGCMLFKRTSRTLLLTDEGQACLPGLAEAFEKLGEALGQIQLVGSSGVLAVSVAPSFASKWLVPRLDGFQSAHPEIDVRVSASNQVVDFSADDFDCAIRYGSGNYPGLVVQKLLTEAVVPVCSPALLEGPNALGAPAALRHHTLLHDDSPDLDPSCPDWRMWLKAAGVEGIDAARGLRFNQSSLVLEAALSGRGVALAKERLASADLTAGRLVKPFGAGRPVDFAYWFVCPPPKTALSKVTLFRDWLCGQASAAAAETVPEPAQAKVTPLKRRARGG
ncbi:MAG: transcriptional regulator GcvA [Alphaproteobacteria bacterium]|nr:transcriptional regulator GcvA [Alphaproteobacteria bacterium]